MSPADDLLALAERLAHEPRPTQATLRLAVSTAYRAVFVLLRDDATCRQIPSTHPNATALRAILSRSFQHKFMSNAARAFAGSGKNAWASASGDVSPALTRVAELFVQLHQNRERADYDHFGSRYTRLETLATVRQASQAFRDWATIRRTPAARVFLLALLVRAIER